MYRCTAVLLLYAAVMDWSVRAAPLLLYCCCTAVMVGWSMGGWWVLGGWRLARDTRDGAVLLLYAAVKDW